MITIAEAKAKWPQICSYILGPGKDEGGNIVYYSPFRDEKTPSFKARKSDGFLKDFGGDFSGDVLDLVKVLRKADTVPEQLAIAEKIIGSPPKSENPGANRGISDNLSTSTRKTDTIPAGLVKRKIDVSEKSLDAWTQADYGLPWSLFREYECAVTTWEFKKYGKHDSISYALSGPCGNGSKIRSIARLKDGKKRLATHGKGGSGFFPARLVGTTGRKIITAGEEKALACIYVGYDALSGSAGEAGINDKLAKHLVSKGHLELLVTMDGDAAGIKGAAAAVNKLYAAGALSVRNWCPPDGMDLNDCLKKYGRDWLAAELEKAWNSEPVPYAPQVEAPASILPPLISWGENRVAVHPPQKWIIDGLLPCTLSAIYGAGKIGKSFLALSLMHSVATGKPFLNRSTHKGNVLFLDYEGNESQWQRRMTENLGFTGTEADQSFYYMRMSSSKHNLMTPEVFAAVKDRIRQIGNVRLIVIDTLERALKSTGRGKTSYQDDVARIEGMQEWASEENICVTFIHHTRKNTAEGGEGYDDASGSRGITGTIENNLTLKRKNGDLFNLNVQSRDVENMDIPVIREGVKWRALDESEYAAAMETKMTAQQKAVLTVLKNQPWLSPAMITNLSGVKAGTVKPMLASWTQSGKTVTKPKGRSTLYALKESIFPETEPESTDADE